MIWGMSADPYALYQTDNSCNSEFELFAVVCTAVPKSHVEGWKIETNIYTHIDYIQSFHEEVVVSLFGIP